MLTDSLQCSEIIILLRSFRTSITCGSNQEQDFSFRLLVPTSQNCPPKRYSRKNTC